MFRKTSLVLFVIATISYSLALLLYKVSSTDIFFPEGYYNLYRVDYMQVNSSSRIRFITVSYDGNIKKIFSRSYSPVTALIDGGYRVSNMNKITATSPISDLQNNSFILVETYKSTIDEILLDIPYDTVIKGNILCKKLSQEVTEQDGVLGLMIQKVKRIYRGNTLIAEEIIEENVAREARTEIIVIKGPEDLPTSVPQRGYDCTYWHAYVDGISASEEEKNWLKFVMKGESGCNAESNKSFHKGLFQWDPCLWYVQYPSDNIFDGEAQIKRTLEKLRAGANPNKMWPNVHSKYKQVYGELSWLQ